MSKNDINIPPYAAEQARELINTLVHNTSVPVIVNALFPSGTIFDVTVDGTNLGIGNISNNNPSLKATQAKMWGDRGVYTSQADRIAINRYMYLELSIKQVVNDHTTTPFEFSSLFSGNDFVGMANKTFSSDGNTITVNFLFRLSQFHINRLMSLIFVPNILQSQLTAQKVFTRNTNVSTSLNSLTLKNSVTIAKTASNLLVRPPTNVSTNFTIQPGLNDIVGLVVNNTARNGVPSIFGALYSGIPSTAPNYNEFFVKQSIGANFFIGTQTTQTNISEDTQVAINFNGTRFDGENAKTTTRLIEMDWIKIHPLEDNNEGVELDILFTSQLDRAEIATCMVVDYGFGPSDTASRYLNNNFLAANSRFYIHSAITLQRGVVAKFKVKRALMFILPLAYIGLPSPIGFNISLGS